VGRKEGKVGRKEVLRQGLTFHPGRGGKALPLCPWNPPPPLAPCIAACLSCSAATLPCFVLLPHAPASPAF
jgi:hypothetical protein